MTSEKAFQLYLSIRLYYTSGYDVFEHGTNFKGKSEVKERNDFKLILPIMDVAKTERQLIELCVANHLYGHPDFLYDPDYAEVNFKHWKKVKESLDYTLERDLDYIEFECFRQKCGLDSYLTKQVVSDLLNQKVEYECIILLDRRADCINKIQGFDSSKYIDRMVKSSKFVAKGTLGHRHSSRIDNFLTAIKGK